MTILYQLILLEILDSNLYGISLVKYIHLSKIIREKEQYAFITMQCAMKNLNQEILLYKHYIQEYTSKKTTQIAINFY